ncbi:hypothetical protein DUZ99_11910 [Xylanibacillus composti]|uniref:Nucleotide kinase n=1 Tax=Xylanibacillus composti TaxID=1572762 RepID=A0A8J4M1R5_9BACL|nr:PRK06851 family protein [Xylanibacillus composti]MDT9725678.1 hypothetical protein [Xylanibacillus composti]GIQ67776.1 hypothetical protein XYCOK13_06000 [Xylanibacillus composti]
METNIKHFYAGGNTARGFISMFDSSLQGLDTVFILKGGPGSGKSTIIRSIGNNLAERGYEIWFVHCPSDNGSLDGVMIPRLKAGIVKGTAPYVLEPKLPGVVEKHVDLGEAWDGPSLSHQKNEIERLHREIASAYEQAYAQMEEALRIHDDWEAIYKAHIDFASADQLTEELIERIFGDVDLGKQAVLRHRFLGAATPQGAVDFIPNLTHDVAKRFFIKGRPGSGKSTMLRKIAAAAEKRGVDLEIYHCGFDPNSLDMVILRELGVAIFDSTAPHEHFPERETDEIVDMYKRCIQPGTDEAYAQEIALLRERYSNKMKEATQSLAHAKKWHDLLENIYVSAMDFRVVDRLRDQIAEELDAIAANA